MQHRVKSKNLQSGCAPGINSCNQKRSDTVKTRKYIENNRYANFEESNRCKWKRMEYDTSEKIIRDE